MTDGVTFDFTEFHRHTAAVEDVPQHAGRYLRQAFEVTARRVKDDWNGKLYREGHARHTGRAITYDLHGGQMRRGSKLVAEIGAERTRVQSGIVKLLEVGSVNNAPHGYGGAALAENEDDFTRGIEKALGDAQRAAGL